MRGKVNRKPDGALHLLLHSPPLGVLVANVHQYGALEIN